MGYTTEVFIPRSLLNVPVFAPGWYTGFDCAVAGGLQPRGRFRGQVWASGDPDRPDTWGDLLLLGTDPQFVARDAHPEGPLSRCVIPGHSYLLTVIDPDRNVRLTAKDTVVVSAEGTGGNGDVEVFILRETKENSGVFRGYINTQPGWGRQVQGIVELMPGQTLRLGYVDFADSKGRRNVIFELRLPVAAAQVAPAKEPEPQDDEI